MQLAFIFCAMSPCIEAHIFEITFTHDQADGHRERVDARNPETIGFTYLAFASSVACYKDSHMNENYFHPMSSVLTSEFVKKCNDIDQFEFEEFDHDQTEVLILKNKNQNKKVAVFAFRGTDDANDVIQRDYGFVTGQVPVWSNWGSQFGSHDGDPKVFGGFLHGFKSLEDVVRREILALKKEHYRIIFTGHSLGGPYAYMSALVAQSLGVPKKKIHVITYGSPKVGNLDFKHTYEKALGCENTIGYHNWNDVVSILPPHKDFSRPCYRKQDQLGEMQPTSVTHLCEHVGGIPFIGELLQATCNYVTSPIDEQMKLGHRTSVYTITLDQEFIPKNHGGGGTQVGHWPRKMCSTGRRESAEMKKWNPETLATRERRQKRKELRR